MDRREPQELNRWEPVAPAFYVGSSQASTLKAKKERHRNLSLQGRQTRARRMRIMALSLEMGIGRCFGGEPGLSWWLRQSKICLQWQETRV